MRWFRRSKGGNGKGGRSQYAGAWMAQAGEGEERAGLEEMLPIRPNGGSSPSRPCAVNLVHGVMHIVCLGLHEAWPASPVAPETQVLRY